MSNDLANGLTREKQRRYAHYCRDEHEEIGHNDSEHERCPLCRANDENDVLREALATLPLDAFDKPMTRAKRKAIAAMLETIERNLPVVERDIPEADSAIKLSVSKYKSALDRLASE